MIQSLMLDANTMIQKKNFVTEEGLKNIQNELAMLKNVKRKEIAQRIQDAKELGDLSENAEYIEAKEEQGFMEARIAELSQITKNAEIITQTTNKNMVQIGSTITIKGEDGSEQIYSIVGSSEANPREQKISNESPFGKAFLERKIGDHVVVQTPSGNRSFHIISIG